MLNKYLTIIQDDHSSIQQIFIQGELRVRHCPRDGDRIAVKISALMKFTL